MKMATYPTDDMISAYADVSVIVDGALEREEMITDETALTDYLAMVESDARDDGIRAEVWIIWHDHSPSVDECSCAQYVTRHEANVVYDFTPAPVMVWIGESGVHTCPCCGDPAYARTVLCSECLAADCQPSRDAGGDWGYSNCQLPDSDA